MLANDTDVEHDPLTAIRVTGPAHGTLSLNPDGSFTYMPAAGFFGSDGFTYKANDGRPTPTWPRSTITVKPVAPRHQPRPTVDITAPAADATVTTLTHIIGTATDENLDHYILEICPVGQNVFTPSPPEPRLLTMRGWVRWIPP